MQGTDTCTCFFNLLIAVCERIGVTDSNDSDDSEDAGGGVTDAEDADEEAGAGMELTGLHLFDTGEC